MTSDCLTRQFYARKMTRTCYNTANIVKKLGLLFVQAKSNEMATIKKRLKFLISIQFWISEQKLNLP
jgi:hypothetical protein